MNSATESDTIVKEITINAPAQRVFEALTDPQQRVKWWGVAGKFQVTHMESDLRPGGAWVMRGTAMGTKPFTFRGEYRAIERPQLLEFTWLHEWEGSVLTTIVRFDLDEKQGATTVRLTHSGLTTEQARQNYQGWPWLLALLRDFVEKQA